MIYERENYDWLLQRTQSARCLIFTLFISGDLPVTLAKGTQIEALLDRLFH